MPLFEFQLLQLLFAVFLYLLPQSVQLFLVRAELLSAVAALEIRVGVLGESFRMSVERDLPSYQQGDRKHQQAPRIRLADKEQRKHHREIPVVDAARAAAFVFEEPRLERAEEHDAYHVAHRVRSAEQYHDAVIEHAQHVQHSEGAVEHYPDESHQHRGS